ncbi:hypothetical protein [Mucilaginibacter pocheonensis]|uniref:Lycopene cyclase domain-containing protein n=1 Tax=Mucilaginibacter pocheonensis TaxID=398050 RepID=A0ABU1TFD4_9SPHI|nr:hypothetical protein [Mucilaginibacter pocheonensis]MDR6944122.1 hypothetical protein [Mucilaginibacter pocheonensis]
MEYLPLMIPAAFILTTLLTLLLLYRAARFNRRLLLVITGWLILQAALTIAGFYLQTTDTPPHFTLLLLPPVAMILVLLFSKPGQRFVDTFDTSRLTLIHSVRIPVELLLFGLYLYHAVPRLMTFEGGNLDIFSGLSAPLIWYFGFKRKAIGRTGLIAWNILCLLLLFNIVGRAILSAPFAFQRFGFEQPNIALLYFPYSWLPGFIVPAVLLAHLITLRKLILNK